MYVGEVKESAAIGSYVLKLSATDRDHGTNSLLSYTIRDEDSQETAFQVMPNGELVTRTNLDREATGSYNLTVTAKDAGKPSLSTEAQILIQILDANDEDPVFTKGNIFVTNDLF